jgi:hypothetical protein
MAAFTTIAAGVGLAATVGSTAMSFAQAGKQKSLAAKAAADADKAMQEAKKALNVNFYASQAIKKEPYELEREALLAQGAQAIEAGVESERGAAATAGRVQMGMNEGQAGIRTAMGREMTELENKQLAEESRLRDVGVQINLGEAEGAQLAARDAEEARAAAIAQGWQGVTSAIGQAAAIPSLYGSQETVETVKEEGLKPVEMAPYKAPLPITSLTPFSGNIQSIQTAGFKPRPRVQPFNPFMYTK